MKYQRRRKTQNLFQLLLGHLNKPTRNILVMSTMVIG